MFKKILCFIIILGISGIAFTCNTNLSESEKKHSSDSSSHSSSSIQSTSNSYKADIGPYKFSTYYTAWTDTTRSWDDDGTTISSREIPIKIYTPDPAYNGTFPLILISHGLGGNTDSLTYMAEHMASYGYIIVAVQHHRSDIKYLNDHGYLKLLTAASESATRRLRLEDMKFVLDKIILQNHTIALLLNRINTTMIGVLGHSFGAFTTLSFTGQKFDNGLDYSDNRILCGIAYSPQGARNSRAGFKLMDRYQQTRINNGGNSRYKPRDK